MHVMGHFFFKKSQSNQIAKKLKGFQRNAENDSLITLQIYT